METNVEAKLCEKITSFADRDIPMVKRGLFKKAFRAAKRGKWAQSAQEMSRAQERMREEVARLFHPPKGTETDNSAIQVFLERSVYAPSPALTVGEDDFQLRPEILMTHAHVMCQQGELRKAAALLERAPKDGHPDLPQAQVTTHLLLGNLDRAQQGIKSMKSGFSKRLLRALVARKSDQITEARKAAKELLETCVGAHQCDWARRVQSAVEAGIQP